MSNLYFCANNEHKKVSEMKRSELVKSLKKLIPNKNINDMGLNQLKSKLESAISFRNINRYPIE